MERRADAAPRLRTIPSIDTVALTRRKVAPMVRGLFPRAEQDPVLAVLEKSVVFLTRENIGRLLRDSHWLHSSWVLANLFLVSIGADVLGDDAPRLVGLSEETTCYVSAEYFEDDDPETTCYVSAEYFEDDDPFADFLVHEVAHIFHNCKRGTVGLKETRRRQWLLDIEYRKRELFAYSCEAFSRIVERARSPKERLALGAEYRRDPGISEHHVDLNQLGAIVEEASGARNGWKLIHARCAPARVVRRRTGAASTVAPE
ncbi:MAG: hypothetical protein IT379_39655 [Deltaproteobacteria bacterium]|nr:hypothetical protein [Deltaproteobacteria bacterium]